MDPESSSWPVEPLANFTDQRQRRQRSSMATGPGGDGNQPVSPFFNSLLGKAIVDNVVQNHAVTAVCGLINLDPRAQRSDPYRHLPLGANLDILLQALVAAVHDLVDGKGCRRSVWVGLIVAVKLFS